MKVKPRPACPRCGGLEFMLAAAPGGGQAHICAACHWPRADVSAGRNALCAPREEFYRGKKDG